MSSYIIRSATVADMPAVHNLVRELAIYEGEEAALTATIADYESDFREDVFEVQVAEQEGEIVGIVLYYLTYSTWKGKMLYLEDFVVKEAHRRAGIGQQLFDTFIEVARKKNCRIVKWQVLDWNEPALNFYKRNNAIIEKEWWNGKIFLTTDV
ncbi:MAG: N-acetyltransferase family protein [Saprospiraceae bacterium]